MEIEKETQRITNIIYAAYGTDTGIVFGINNRGVVEAIVKTTLEEEHRN